MIRIGIDVGGTNTDAALLDGSSVIASVKTLTTQDVTSGVRKALAAIIEAAGEKAHAAGAVIIGTTHFINAVAERKALNKVAAIRLCLPASSAVPPFADWPGDLRVLVRGDSYLLPGGHEVDGRQISTFDEALTREAARKVADSGVRAIAISSVFSPLRSEHEERAADIFREICPDATITLSKDIGRFGLLERENVAILNAALSDLAAKVTAAFRDAMAGAGLSAKLYLTQNDGTVTTAEVAERTPVFCFSSGPTNSMRGAAFLSGLENAVVIDVGGTTSDIGVLKNGFPREANTAVEVGGVRTLFRMPDVISLPLGGGTIIHDNPRKLGPDSVGYRLMKEARIFGGASLTATDIAVARGRIRLGDASRVSDLGGELCGWFDEAATRLLEDGVEAMKSAPEAVPVIAVGGGSFLIPERLKGVSDVIFVDHHTVANAVGAAIAQVSGDVDQVFSDVGRDEAIAQATQTARRKALEAGADESSLKVVDIEDVPLAYMPGANRRIRVRVAGDLAEPR